MTQITVGGNCGDPGVSDPLRVDAFAVQLRGRADDELAAWVDVLAHEQLEDLGHRVDVVEGDPPQGAVRRIHGRLRELVGVHLAEALVPLDGLLDRPASLAEAREKGDLSENSEYDAAKEAQAHLEDKINRLKTTISEAKIVDTSRLNTDSVQILTKVEMTTQEKLDELQEKVKNGEVHGAEGFRELLKIMEEDV